MTKTKFLIISIIGFLVGIAVMSYTSPLTSEGRVAAILLPYLVVLLIGSIIVAIINKGKH